LGNWQEKRTGSSVGKISPPPPKKNQEMLTLVNGRLGRKNGMNSKDQNEETKKEKEASEESKVCYSCVSTQFTITFLLFGLNTGLFF
jgi:hypothetical protein